MTPYSDEALEKMADNAVNSAMGTCGPYASPDFLQLKRILFEALKKVRDERPPVIGEWHAGWPDKIYGKEWFIALTIYNEKVVLKALPEEYSYDFHTADDTYIKKERIKCWMQFPDSDFIPHERLAAVWPSEDEIQRWLDQTVECTCGKDAINCWYELNNSERINTFYLWLRENVKLITLPEPISDEELRIIAIKSTQKYSGDANPVPYGAIVGFELGYRAREKALLGKKDILTHDEKVSQARVREDVERNGD